VKAQLAMLAHIYKLEIVELCGMAGLWVVGVIEDLSALAWSIVAYNPHQHHHHHHHHDRRRR